jgi:hypothetical protein
MVPRLTNQQPATTTLCDINEAHDDENPPDGGYGWVCVAACFTLNCFTWGAVSASQHHPYIENV